MTNAEATRAAREATVSDERHLLPETLTIESRSRRKHFTHAWTALGAFVANDDDGTLGNLTVLDGGKSIFLAIKNMCGTTELQAMNTRNLDDCAIRKKASLQTDNDAGSRVRVFYVFTDSMVRLSGKLIDFFTDVLARNTLTIIM